MEKEVVNISATITTGSEKGIHFHDNDLLGQ